MPAAVEWCRVVAVAVHLVNHLVAGTRTAAVAGKEAKNYHPVFSSPMQRCDIYNFL